MSLNPIQFGKEVIDQYGRYLLTTFRLTDPRLSDQLREGLAYGPGSHERLAKGPYVFLNRPFVQGPGIRELIEEGELGLHPALSDLFRFETLHKHQERCLRGAVDGRHVLMSTGTGSGKTEGFLLPILDACLKLRDDNAPAGVAAVLVYPMNALVNDQLERLRRLLAGSRITFGRYTGETPEEFQGAAQLEQPRRYTPEEIQRADSRLEELPLPWEECASRQEIRERRPRLLLTNYSMLEYLLLRDRDLELFRDAPLRFFVLDEIHTYTGTLGSEVACLLRRLRGVAGKSADDVVCIGSSATVTDREGGAEAEAALRSFASRLLGVDSERIDLVEEEYQPQRPVTGERYVPPVPDAPRELLAEILQAVRQHVIAEEVHEVSPEVLELAGELCGRPAPGGDGSTLERLHSLLAPNRLAEALQEAFTEPTTLEDVLPRIRPLGGRSDVDDADLQAEILAYLTLGALARCDDEPLMRPKLHYFIQGLHGLWVRWESGAAQPRPTIGFTDHVDGDVVSFPLSFCRACGQHYVLAAAGQWEAVDAGPEGTAIRSVETISHRGELDEADGEGLYFTDRLLTREGEEDESVEAETRHLCRFCGALHESEGEECLQPRCKRAAPLVPLLVFDYPVSSCPACKARSTERSPVITPVRSSEVYDVMILAQTMLAAMPEPTLRKVLIFSDSRQDAAFQAGWMESRSLRFRLRHLTYQVLEEAPDRWWYFGDLCRDVIDRATDEGLVPRRGRARKAAEKRLVWMLLEEFGAATERQRRNSLEQLGLARVRYEGLAAGDVADLARQWGPELGIDAAELGDLGSLLLDIYRNRHALSHELLRRAWNDRDREVRDGVVSVPEYYRPQIVAHESPQDRRLKYFVAPYRSRSGATAGERLVRSALPRVKAEVRDRFLEALWDWMIREELLVPATLVRRRFGKLAPIGLDNGYHVNIDLMQVGHTDQRYVCDQCGRAQGATTPNDACPRSCEGTLQLRPRDDEHYDVVQYSRFEFVPLQSREHSAQVPQNDRLSIEREFKRPEGRVNCLVATPTLEMGVDIGPLEMVMMRNVPPSPANYAQRAGRAGRRHRIGAIFSYCRNRQHDQYFYREPPAMIAGQVRIPAISMRNEPLIRRHVHSALLAALRELPGGEDALREALPTYVWPYIGERDPEDPSRRRYRLELPEFPDLRALVREHRDALLIELQETFARQWPEEDADAVSDDTLEEMVDSFVEELESAAGTLVAEARAYKQLADEFRDRERAGEVLPEEDRRRKDNYERALHRLWLPDFDHYTLSYLSRRGFFPGYALVRDSVQAVCPEPPLELHRPLAPAIRELTPASRLYANRQQFKVRRLDFYKFQAGDPDFEPDQLQQEMVLDPEHDRVLPIDRGMEGGEEPGVSFRSLQLIDVELEGLAQISDQDEYRRVVAYQQHSLELGEHRGGRGGRVGTVPYRFLKQARLRLVNLGPKGERTQSPTGLGFPVCPVCGEARSPFASTYEIDDFVEHHTKRCGDNEFWHALHVDITSDFLALGPFDEDPNAVNVLESIRVGTQRILETGDQELEIELLTDDNGRTIGVLFDPLPGGSGLLDLTMEYWESIIDAAKDVLSRCDCDVACYKCLLHYRNQQHHGTLDRHRAMTALSECHGEFHHEHDIPPKFVTRQPDTTKTDSDREDDFVTILERRGFPLPPESQYRVDLGGGSVTIADFAYPDEKLLIFIDGLSKRIHGNPEQRRRDQILRVKARSQGWQVLEMSAESLGDESMLSMHLEELAIYLGDSGQDR